MELEIITHPLEINIHGFGGFAVNKDYVGTAFKLSGKMWETVKREAIKNKGKNIWVYEGNEKVFAGVALEDPLTKDTELEHKIIVLEKYAYYKHIGPYGLIKEKGQMMTKELNSKGFDTTLPYIEIYGHWNSDEEKCETELFMSLK